MHIAEVARTRVGLDCAMAGGREDWAFIDAVIPSGAMASDFSSVYYKEPFFGFCMLQ